jgi:hypothetical protein
MSARSDEQVDSLILAFAQVQWRKVAMIVGQVVSECRRSGRDLGPDDVAKRISALVEIGQLEAQGDLSKWRHSEVRLPTRIGSSPR